MRITPAERRRLLGHRHLLTPGERAGLVEDVAETLVGLHATDAASVVLSARARVREPSPEDVDRALYEDRTLLRMHCMRRTLFVVPTDLVPVFHHSTSEAIAKRERAVLLKHLAATGPARNDRWLNNAEKAALEALTRLGEAGAVELTAEVPALQETIVLSPGKPYQATQRVGGWVLRLLAMEGRIRRGRPLGGWTSNQFRYSVAPQMPAMDPAEARTELVRRWLACYGPGTVDDLAWWTGLPNGQVREALGRIATTEVELAEGAGLVLADGRLDEALSQDDAAPWAAFLPGLDPATMGWKHRDWYVDPAHRPLLYDSAGNGGPTVWWNGEIVGAWAQRADGEIAWRLLTDRGAQARAAVEAGAAALQEWLAHYRMVARFPAPLTKELTS
ncbi:winged helix DNA-binding domain-containing protein [Streptomyces sp. NPDC048604]|uniref:winged helix DNA-binding domain-containing protein n=1 Tax=Streptomyces sp. NPDC048604 TaxID=3365578 RepID=UPI0037178C7B